MDEIKNQALDKTKQTPIQVPDKLTWSHICELITKTN